MRAGAVRVRTAGHPRSRAVSSAAAATQGSQSKPPRNEADVRAEEKREANVLASKARLPFVWAG